MKKTIVIKLSKDSLDDARQEIRQTKQWLIDKNAELVKRLAEIGVPVIERKINETIGDSDRTHYTHVEVKSYQTYATATLKVEGKDILFIEYGAGIHYNGAAGSSPHPWGMEKGYTIGSYGRGLGKNDHWSYIDATGARQVSYGTKATMPVYSAYQTILDEVERVANEVFNG